jgi:hypothetical protein
MSDYPDFTGYSGAAHVPVYDLDIVGYWYVEHTQFTVAANRSNTFTITIPQRGFYYALRTLDVEPWYGHVYTAVLSLNNTAFYSLTYNTNALIELYNLRHVFATYGDAFKITIHNRSSDNQTYGLFPCGAMYKQSLL